VCKIRGGGNYASRCGTFPEVTIRKPKCYLTVPSFPQNTHKDVKGKISDGKQKKMK